MIDKSIGVTLGISTLAAAGLGNLLSDIVGLGAGDLIGRYSAQIIGDEVSAPLTAEQLALRAAKIVRAWASVIGISIGCILGMCPLLFLGEKKELYFTTEEMELYESALRPYGVSPQNFFDLMRISKWRELKQGDTLIQAGSKMDRVVLVASGSVDSYEQGADGGLRRLYRYRAKTEDAEPAADEAEMRCRVPIRGCVIGGTALLDDAIRQYPYPSTVIAAAPARVVEWKYEDLRAEMNENNAIESAIMSILYFDLVAGLRRQRGNTLTGDEQIDGGSGAPTAGAGENDDERLKTYQVVLKVALMDGVVQPSERKFIAEYTLDHSISDLEHQNALKVLGWTKEQWIVGLQGEHMGAQHIKDAIPGLMKKAGIKSRLTVRDEVRDEGRRVREEESRVHDDAPKPP